VCARGASNVCPGGAGAHESEGHDESETVLHMRVCVCVRACVVCVRACVRVRACVYARACVACVVCVVCADRRILKARRRRMILPGMGRASESSDMVTA
jgi:hypothetical protein